jgi:hypothetical protein
MTHERIKAKLEQLEVVLELKHGDGSTIAERLGLIVTASIALRTKLEDSRREAAKWRRPVLALTSSMRAVLELESRGEGRS